ncbi:MAG: outer membrane beta-barrel domain-containing protein [Gammaproteobacteria bacterium]|nr:outer membrane beta-barrel domain-containing protein [Gammaproteobacteria bacterium]MDH3507172.1 outer membrane beta-barrel domain-containing protein [Gammaproteobacteria bacterium]
MESRVLFLLLINVLVVMSVTGCARFRGAQDGEPVVEAGQVPVIEPELERRDIQIAAIDTEDFELGLYAGLMSIEDFGVNSVAGARFAYHITEKYFVELAAGASEGEETSFERLSGAAQLLTDDERSLSYYNLSLGYNIFPGEVYLGSDRAFNSTIYLIGGVGKTNFAGDDRFTLNFGMGVRLIPRDWFAIHADIRDNIYDIDLLGQEKTTHNLEAHLGVTFFF